MSEKYNAEDIKRELESEKVPEKLEPENIKHMLDSINAPKSKKIRSRRSIVMKITSIAAACTVILGTSVYFAKSGLMEKNLIKTSVTDSDHKNTMTLRVADDYKDVYSYFKIKNLFNDLKNTIDFGFNGVIKSDESSAYEMEEYDGVMENGVSDDNINAEGTNSGNTEHSDTYNQEEGVLEADIVKTDGKSIYYASNNKIKVAEVSDGNFINSYIIDVDTQLGNESACIRDMYIYNGNLIVISTAYDNYYTDDMDCYMTFQSSSTCISFYDTNGQLSYLGTYIQEGGYNDVRITADGYLYLISNDEKYYGSENFKKDDIEEYVPQYCVNGQSDFVDPSCIVMPPNSFDDYYSYASYVNVSGFDLNSSDITAPVDLKSIAGYSGNIYCSQKNLYVTFGYDDTQITRLSIEKGMIIPEATGKIKGYVNDQFSMSEYNGYFRIASTISTWDGYDNALYVLDMELKNVGQISGFGTDETIRSVNFSGDTAYVVTFMQTDPLYAIDLSNPEAPVLLDEYKMPGYSSYMQKWDDGLLLGFGAAADENGWETGIKLTMFDNSEPSDLKELSTAEIECSSEALYERKALIIDPEKNLIGFPAEQFKYYDTMDEYISSFEFYSFVNGQLTYRGSISGSVYRYSYIYETYTDEDNNDVYSPLRRAVYIGNYVYVVSDILFKSADMETLTEKDQVNFS
ncbi:MAG: beta-propeller domain-containing protein [Porcipelethomonas sp.]